MKVRPSCIRRLRVRRPQSGAVRECSNKIGSTEQYLRLAVQGRAAVAVLVPALHEELARMKTRANALVAA